MNHIKCLDLSVSQEDIIKQIDAINSVEERISLDKALKDAEQTMKFARSYNQMLALKQCARKVLHDEPGVTIQ